MVVVSTVFNKIEERSKSVRQLIYVSTTNTTIKPCLVTLNLEKLRWKNGCKQVLLKLQNE